MKNIYDNKINPRYINSYSEFSEDIMDVLNGFQNSYNVNIILSNSFYCLIYEWYKKNSSLMCEDFYRRYETFKKELVDMIIAEMELRNEFESNNKVWLIEKVKYNCKNA